MAVSPAHEAAVVREVTRDPAACVVMAAATYRRADGALPVYREGLQEFLHRRLYRLLVAPLGRERIARTCDTWGCVNPHHYRATGERAERSPDRCPNGHEYTPENTTDSGHCRICSERRQAARAARTAKNGGEINAAKTHCPNNHPYSGDNLYQYRTPSGWHRKCRACARAAAAKRRRLLTPT